MMGDIIADSRPTSPGIRTLEDAEAIRDLKARYAALCEDLAGLAD